MGITEITCTNFWDHSGIVSLVHFGIIPDHSATRLGPFWPLPEALGKPQKHLVAPNALFQLT